MPAIRQLWCLYIHVQFVGKYSDAADTCANTPRHMDQLMHVISVEKTIVVVHIFDYIDDVTRKRLWLLQTQLLIQHQRHHVHAFPALNATLQQM